MLRRASSGKMASPSTMNARPPPFALALATALAATPACSSRNASTARGQGGASPSSGPVVASSADVAASAAPDEAALAPVGMVDTTLPAEAATKENDAALARLKKGDVKGAAEGFRRALGLSPGFVLARYNLACALAKAGDFDGTERELAAVFELDLMGLRAQAARDDDLAAFRESPQAKRLAAGEPALEARYKAALGRGVRALLWLARGREASEPAALRVGVWDAKGGRFVATNERRRDALAALVTPDLPYAVLVAGSVPKAIGGDLADHVSVREISYWPYTTAGRPLAVASVGKGAFSGALRVVRDRAALDLRSAVGFGDPDKGPELHEARVSFAPAEGVKEAVASKLPEPPAFDASGPRATLKLPFHHGAETWSAPAGYSLRKRALRLPDGRELGLPKSYVPVPNEPSIAASPSGDAVGLSWDTHSCGDECGGGYTVGSHRIVLVRTGPGGGASLVDEGTGVGAVRFDPSGKMFVQRDRQAFEWGPSGPGAPLPPGVLLVAPAAPEAEIQCCGF